MADTHFTMVARQTLEAWTSARRRVIRAAATRATVHEWRICTRRLLALEALLAPRVAADAPDSLSAALHDAFRASGKLRDAQLCHRAMQALAQTLPQAALLARHEKRRVPRLKRRLLRELGRLQAGRLAQRVDSWLTAGQRDPETQLRSRAMRRLAVQQRWLARPLAAHPTPHRLHLRRIRLKQVRYMAELGRAAGCPLPRNIEPRQLSELQNALGARTDIDMELRAVARYAADHPQWRVAARSLRRALQLRRAQLPPLRPPPRAA